MKSIAHFILSMSIGGGEKLVRRLSQQLHLPGYFNQVVCFDRIDAFADEFVRAKVPLTLVKRKQCLFDLHIVPPLVQRIKREHIRLIHAHDLSSLAYAVVAGKLSGAKVIMTEHSRHYIDHALKRRLEKRFFMAGASRLIPVSNALKQAAIEQDHISPQKITVIENGVDMGLFEAAPPARLHETLGIAPTHPLILCVGRLEPIKGQQHLIQAMATRLPGLENHHLILVGDGGNRASLEAQVRKAGLSENIHFLGNRNDVPELMACCALLVIPSESEGLPFVLLEAMAAGLPVVATSVGQIPGVLGDHERGVLVPPRNPLALAQAMERLLKSDTSVRVHNARLHVAQNYSERTMLHRYAQVYRRLLH